MDNDGNPRVEITADETGGRIDLISTHETGCGISVSFQKGQPLIVLFDKDGRVALSLTANDEGGYVGIGAADTKAKLILCVEDGRGCVATGEELCNLSELKGSG